MAIQDVQIGARVICGAASIDARLGAGEGGVVQGFARFSAYHGREAMVRLDSGESHWFWLRDLTVRDGEAA